MICMDKGIGSLYLLIISVEARKRLNISTAVDIRLSRRSVSNADGDSAAAAPAALVALVPLTVLARVKEVVVEAVAEFEMIAVALASVVMLTVRARRLSTSRSSARTMENPDSDGKARSIQDRTAEKS
jgi:hypothetical protein